HLHITKSCVTRLEVLSDRGSWNLWVGVGNGKTMGGASTFRQPHLVFFALLSKLNLNCIFPLYPTGGGDILSSSSLKLYGSSVLEWKPLCPSDPSTPAVSLCWQHHKNHSQCFPVQNSTLHDRDWVSTNAGGGNQGSVFSEWDVTVVTGSQRLHVRLSSSITASFSAQLCVEEEGEYVAKGNVHSVHMVSNYTEHSRYMWRCAERKPVLLVSSSDDAVHVAAVCALASGLQEELHTDVRLAQWAHCSTHASLAQLGPAPWLYGQCQEVQQAGGVVLLAWSLEAQQAFLQWRESGGKKERENSWWRGKISDEEKDTVWSNEQHKDKQKEGWMERASSVTDPVFNATLSSLWSGLHSERCGQGFGLVCFQDLGGSRHIPKELRGVRRYCLPRDLSSLIHELDLKESSPGGGDKKASRGWCCWPRFFSKALSFWLSHRLAQRLEAWLPQKKQDREKSKLILKLSHKPHGKLKKKKKKLKKKGEKKRKGPVTVHS
uniref:SEFIR domain-containing protein n=1 Tax=Pygocentrus nattereri TaxID=42514 RepID=A0AAR2LY73_PYGNA